MSRKKGIFSSISRVSPRASQATHSEEITDTPLVSMTSPAESLTGAAPSEEPLTTAAASGSDISLGDNVMRN
jgi:hypothetical protein